MCYVSADRGPESSARLISIQPARSSCLAPVLSPGPPLSAAVRRAITALIGPISVPPARHQDPSDPILDDSRHHPRRHLMLR